MKAARAPRTDKTKVRLLVVNENELMDSLGMKVTKVNSRTPGREASQKQYGWGQTTPYEMATLMEKIVKGEVINKNASAKILRLLGRNYWDEVAISQIPSDVFVASKSGAVDASRSEVLFVNGKHCLLFQRFKRFNRLLQLLKPLKPAGRPAC